MNASHPLAFRLNLLLLVLGLMLVCAGGSLGLVYLRVQIEQSAGVAQSLEREVVELERFERFLDSRIAANLQPRELNRLLASHDLEMRPPTRGQTIHVRNWQPPADIDRSHSGEDARLAAAQPREGFPSRVNVALLPAGHSRN